MGPVNAPGDTAFPSEFDSLSVNECTIKGNISDHSSMKAMKMVKQGKNNIIEGPSYKQRELSWKVKRRSNDKHYDVSIAAKYLISHRNKREAYKNYDYKCSCEDFKVC